MRNLIYSIGIASFLACMIFTVATSLTNPFYEMSESALGQATTYISTTGNSSGNFSYSINPYRYSVYVGEATITFSTQNSNITKEGGGSLGYGIIGVNGKVTMNPKKSSRQVSINIGKAVNCMDGGYKECFKTPDIPTYFYN